MIKNLCLFIVLVFSLLFISPTLYAEDLVTPGYHDGSLTHDGLVRTYKVYIPTLYVVQKPQSVALVIVLHGRGSNAKNAAQITGFSLKANTEGFIVVYPNGTGWIGKELLLSWNSGNCCGYAFGHDVDDVGFIRALIEKLEKKLPIDPKRIYVTGISNGAMMAYRLGCELSDRIAAIGPVSGALNIKDCKPSHPLSVIIFHGMNDDHIFYRGGKSLNMKDGRERVDTPVSYAVSFWVKHNQCSAAPQSEEKGRIIKDLYTGGLSGTEVILNSIKGGGHAWPGGKKMRNIGADDPVHAVPATDMLWEFFKNHPKQ
ncbi:MAG TPA: PHB depolymerase family esterase [Syntrophorhabdaceae bacterium]|nr:PHB depolymerase family esterase [Syntrophorhabdaceae bacterium]HQM81084.1 PHB depolymerase family esterase [Syntrophorhabdaceae bacterium]